MGIYATISNVTKMDHLVANLDESKIEDRLILDLEPMAQAIERHFGSFLKPPPVGVYKADSIEPALLPSKMYYVKEKNGKLVPISDINAIKQAVYDADGKLIIPALYMREKKTMLSDTPIRPYRGFYIAEQVLLRCIDNFIAWRRHKNSTYDRISAHFTEEFLSNETDEHDFYEAMENIDFALTKNLQEWMDDKHWHIFVPRRRDATFMVERYGDYRVEDWMSRFNSGEIKL